MIAQASPAAGPLGADPSKRVNYTLGLVLGVDEFQQDQLYHAAGRRGHNRLLHGYGTVWGLRVAAETEGADPEIQVDPGVAVDPCGREICIPDRMCVKLTRWLDRHRSVLEPLYPDPTAQPLPLAVILCHRECPTDTVPVPGEPCRTQEDAMAASRITEGFELKLALRDDAPWGSPPSAAPTGLTVFKLSQPEEQAVRAFGLLLARVQTTTDPELSAEGEEVLMAGVLALKTAADEGTLASPPVATDDPILLPAATAPDIIRRALRLWVTEVRPVIRGLEEPDGCGDADGECCVLLAEIDLPLTADWAVAAAPPVVPQEDRRPYLLHTRLLQEWLIAGGGEEGRPDVDSWATLQILGPNRIRAWVHHAEWLDLPPEALTVVINDQALAPEQVTEVPYAGIRNVWDVVIAQEMSDGDVVEIRFDTEQVPLVSPPPAPSGFDMVIALDAAPAKRSRKVAVDVERIVVRWLPSTAERTGTTVADELRGPTGEYLDRYGWSLSAFTVYDRLEGGDLEGEYKLPIVAKIQQFPVDPATPAADQYLVSDGAKWLPQYLPDGTRDLEHRYPDCTVRGIQGTAVSPTAPEAQQYLVFDGTTWVPEFLPNGRQDLDGRYPESTVVGLQQTPVSNAPPKQEQYLKFDIVSGQWIPADLPDATGDLVGRYPSLEIARLQKKTVSAASPADGQFLVFRESSPPGNGSWVPGVPVFGPGSDLGGAYPGNQLARLQGRRVDAAGPAEGQVLTFRESSPPGNGRWVPAAPPSGGAAGPAGGDLGLTYPNPQIARLQGRTLDVPAPLDGQVLVFRESSPPGNGRWIAVNPPSGGAAGPAGGDLSLTYPNPQVARLQGRTLDAPAPTDGQVLLFRESSPPGNGRWIAVNPPSGGGGPPSGTAGGDLAGSYPNPQVDGIVNVPVQAPGAAQDGVFLQLQRSVGRWVPVHAVGAPGGVYEIVGAGEFDLNANPPVARSSYNGLKLTFAGIAGNNAVYQLEVTGFDPQAWSYIVKGTVAAGVVCLRDANPLQVEVIKLGSVTEMQLMQLEVSRFPIAPRTAAVSEATRTTTATRTTRTPIR